MKSRALLGRANDIVKTEYTCVNGPMHGHKLWLSTGYTLLLTVRGKTGRYVRQHPFSRKILWRKHA